MENERFSLRCLEERGNPEVIIVVEVESKFCGCMLPEPLEMLLVAFLEQRHTLEVGMDLMCDFKNLVVFGNMSGRGGW